MTQHRYEVAPIHEDDETEYPNGYKVVKTDNTGMPVDEWHLPTKALARRSASNRRYAEKTRRPVVRK